jgi:thiamine biosynthesis lipoprotein
MTAPRAERRSFFAMGCPMEIIGVEVSPGRFEAEAEEIVALAERWEAALSRFRPESALCRLNAAAGTGPLRTDDLVFDLVEAALEMSRRSKGYFNPLILPSLQRAGYDRDFSDIGTAPVPGDAGTSIPDIEEIELFPEHRTIALSAGAHLDLGGIVKGAFLDAVVEEFGRFWPGGCIDAGGDLRIWGRPPSGDRWRVGIEDPFDPSRDLAQAVILDPERAGAIATSGRNRRRWRTAGGYAHHLVDPMTGLPAAGSIETATAFAATGIAADVAAKALFLSLSRHESPLLVDAVHGIAIDEQGAGLCWSATDELAIDILPVVVRTA